MSEEMIPLREVVLEEFKKVNSRLDRIDSRLDPLWPERFVTVRQGVGGAITLVALLIGYNLIG